MPSHHDDADQHQGTQVREEVQRGMNRIVKVIYRNVNNNHLESIEFELPPNAGPIHRIEQYLTRDDPRPAILHSVFGVIDSTTKHGSSET